MRDDIIKYLELIQTVTARMASNSFFLKGWTITIAAGLFALAAKDSNIHFALLALFPALAFWGLDAYYLRQERLFRELYKEVCYLLAEPRQNYPLFSLDTSPYQKKVSSWFKTLWSPTVVAVHATVVLVILIVLTVFLVDP